MEHSPSDTKVGYRCLYIGMLSFVHTVTTSVELAWHYRDIGNELLRVGHQDGYVDGRREWRMEHSMHCHDRTHELAGVGH